MRVSDALERLDAIHEQLAKAEVYRGFRGSGVALAGLLGLVAAATQPLIPAAAGPDGFVAYWVVVALVGAGLGGGAAVHAYLFREDEFARRRTRRVQAQFLPCLAAGVVLTLALARGGPELVPFLPGAWALLFGLGIVSARPYLPRATGWVALFYLGTASWLLLRPGTAEELSGWSVGGVFGPGHLLTAVVLWRNRERETDG